MKRRVLLIRTLTTSASAFVFTAVGWLMGAKTLTMPNPDDPPPTPCESGVVVERATRKCLDANCPSFTGDCYQNCWKFWCPQGYVWACKVNAHKVCCEDTDCPA